MELEGYFTQQEQNMKVTLSTISSTERADTLGPTTLAMKDSLWKTGYLFIYFIYSSVKNYSDMQIYEGPHMLDRTILECIAKWKFRNVYITNKRIYKLHSSSLLTLVMQ